MLLTPENTVMSTRSYLILTGITIFVLVAVLLLGPVNQEKTEDARLWQEKWQKIEYVENDKAPRLRLLRMPHLLRDFYYVESPITGQPDNYLRRRGNYAVKNLFSNWYNPRLLAYYPETPKNTNLKRELRETGLQNSKQKLLFYKSLTGLPITLTLGKSFADGSIFVRSSQHPSLVLVVADHLIKQQFTKRYANYWSREVLYFPQKSYITTIQIEHNEEKLNIDHKSQKQSQSKDKQPLELPMTLYLQQQQVKEKETIQKFWTVKHVKQAQNNATEVELPLRYGRQLANAIKRIRIDLFANDKTMQPYGSTQELWKKSKNDILTIKVSVHNAGNYILRFRKLMQAKLAHKVVKYALLYNSLDKGEQIDYVLLSRIQTLLEHSKQIYSYMMESQPNVEQPKKRSLE